VQLVLFARGGHVPREPISNSTVFWEGSCLGSLSRSRVGPPLPEHSRVELTTFARQPNGKSIMIGSWK